MNPEKELLLMVHIKEQAKAIVRPLRQVRFVESVEDIEQVLSALAKDDAVTLGKPPTDDICIFPYHAVDSVQVLYSTFEPRKDAS